MTATRGYHFTDTSPPMTSPFYWLIGFVSWLPMRALFRLRSTGLENLPAGGFVLCANHNSNLDPWPLGQPLWPRRQLHFMAKAELFNPILGPPLRAGGAFPVRRGQQDMKAIETAIRLCKTGQVVAMFPEGTRRSKGLRKKFESRPHTGSARIALAAHVPLVPAAIKGTDRIGRLGALRIAYGRPIPSDDLHGMSHKQMAVVMTERLMEEIRRLHATL